MKVQQGKQLSRRELFFKAGRVAAGTALLTAGGLSLVPETQAKAPFPWPYKKLDFDEVARLAYENWYKNFCCYAVTSGILIPLKKKVGEPYTHFPVESTRWGHGGAVGWGTLCGTLTGVGIVTGLVAGRDGEKILNDVIAWYTDTDLPVFTPERPKSRIIHINKSDSPLCHISVGRWMKKEGVTFYTPQRAERCARLSADVASKTVKLLNAWSDGSYVSVHGYQAKTHEMPSQNNCGDCHS